MPSLADLTRTFASEDLDPDLAKQLEPLFRYLNANFGAIKDAIGGGLLGIADNLFCEIVTAGFTHNTAQYIGLRKLQTAAAAIALRADGQVVVAAPEVVMSGPRKAKVTLRFNDPTATNVSVVLLMLTEGSGARATAATWIDRDTVWTAPTLLNLWAATGGTEVAPGYFRDAGGFVHLRGSITAGANGTVVCTLPTGYRPSATHQFAGQGWDGAAFGSAFFKVKSSGDVEFWGGTFGAGAGNCHLSGITFDTRS